MNEDTAEVLLEEEIQSKIYKIRDKYVMLDRDLAELYQVETRVLNQAVKRNIARFPDEFMFQLTDKELEDWISQIVISNSERMGIRKKPFVFTEQGVSMLSAVLKSQTAIEISIKIINNFVHMRKFFSKNAGIFQRLENIVYHFGASLKDLGKKWFAFSRFEREALWKFLLN